MTFIGLCWLLLIIVGLAYIVNIPDISGTHKLGLLWLWLGLFLGFPFLFVGIAIIIVDLLGRRS